MLNAFCPGDREPAHRPHLERAVLLYLFCMLVLWFSLTAISHKAPDLDGMEELVWASSFELGYLKHPPLPSWVMYALTQVFGRPVWLSFLAGMLASTLALWFLWKLAREMLPPPTAFIVVLLASVNIYFSLRGTIFNHNTAQLWSIIACIWFFYRACRFEKGLDWALLGVVAGIALMTKYSAVIQFAAFFLYLLVSGLWRKSTTWKGALIALFFLFLTFSPHLYWLHEHGYAPLRYMDKSLAAPSKWQAYKALIQFTLDQLARLSPMLIAVAVLHYWRKKTLKQKNQSQPAVSPALQDTLGAALSRPDRQFLLWVGLSPFLSTVLLAAISATHLDASWATTFFVLYSFYLLYFIKGPAGLQLRHLIMVVISLHLIMAIGYAIARGPLAWESGRKSRSSFPGPEVAALMHSVWQQYVPDRPLSVVAADTWLGGNIAVNLGPHVDVFIDADPASSPWLKMPQDLECGVLVVFSRQTRGEPDPRLLELHQNGHWRGQLSLPWSSSRSPQIDLNWAIIPATERCEHAPDSP